MTCPVLSCMQADVGADWGLEILGYLFIFWLTYAEVALNY